MIKLRAHHLLCIPRFYSGGYDKKFAENMKKICLQIRKNPNQKIKIIAGKPDELCDKCPHLCNEKCIQSEKIGRWVVAQDKKIIKFLRIKPNKVYLAKDIFNLSIKKVNEKNINKICGGCIFLKNCVKVGINESFQKDLNRN